MNIFIDTISEKSISELIANNNIKILGQIIVIESDYEQLIKYTKNKVKNLYLSSIPRPDLILSLTLVNIAIKRYQEGKYWKCFQEEIDSNLPSSKLNYIGQIFAKTLRYYHLWELERDNNSSQMYVENIKAHAFVTNYYMDGFFDFSFAFYENNLFRVISDDIQEDIDSLSDFMKTTLSNDKDAFSSYDSTKKAAKFYKLLKSTRAFFAQCQFQTVYSVFYPVLVLIDKYYYEEELPTMIQNRFESYFVEWCDKQKKSENSIVVTKKRVRNVYSRKPIIRVDVLNEKAYIVIPPQKFRDEDCDGRASVSIICGGEVNHVELEIYKSFGMYISEEIRLSIENIFDEIEIIIHSNSDKKYHFKNSNYRIFNSSWESISRFSKGHNYILVKKGINVIWNNDEHVIDYTNNYLKWQYYSANIDDSTICYVGNKPISIIGEFSTEPVFDSIIEEFTIADINMRSIVAVREHPSVSFVVPKRKYEGTTVIINEKKYLLKDIAEKNTYEWPEDHEKYAISLVLDDLLGNKDGRYNIILDIPGEINRNVCEYILLCEFNCRLDKELYIYEDYGNIIIKKTGYDIVPCSNNWSIDCENDKAVLYSFPIEEDMDSVKFLIKMKEEQYYVSYPLNLFKYGFSNTSMARPKTDFIWYKELGESLYVFIPKANLVEAFWMRSKKDRYEGIKIGTNLFRIDISEIVKTIKEESKRRVQYINLEYKDERTHQIPLPPVQRSAIVEPYFKIESENNNVFVDLSVKGEAEIFVDIYDNHTGEIQIANRKIESGINYLPELSPEGFYDLYPYMIESDEFGFDEEKTTLKYLKGVGCVDYNNLTKCRLTIKEILVDEEALKLEYKYLINVEAKEMEDIYIGSIHRVPIQGEKLDWNNRRVFGQVKIKIYQKDEEMKFSLLMYSKDEEDWMPPYYDTLRNYILGCDNKLIYETKDYRRFIPMEEDYTEFIVEMEGIRRIN